MGNTVNEDSFNVDDCRLTPTQYLDRLVIGYVRIDAYDMNISLDIINIFYLYIGDTFELHLDNSCYNTYRIIVLGLKTCGKSSLTIRSVVPDFFYEYDPTIEDYYKILLEIDKVPAYLEVWDPSYEEFQYESFKNGFYKLAHGFLFVYSITSKISFEYLNTLKDDIITARKFYFSNNNVKNIPIVIAGNKCDLEELRQVTKNEGKELANLWNCPFYETSAKNKIHHKVCFEEVVREIRRFRETERDNETAYTSNKTCILNCC
eukprot:105534_1